jgi:hypothetical protein
MLWCQVIEVAAYPNFRLFHGIVIYCNRLVGLTNNNLDTIVQVIEQSVIETEHSQEFQESLTRDYPALVHSVFCAHRHIYSLLSSVVY